MKIVAFSSDKDFQLFDEKFKNNGLEISCLVTETPKAQGRNLQIRPNGAHKYALQNNIPVLVPDSLDKKFLDELGRYEGMLGFVFAYGKIIPSSVINCFEKGILNIHFSLLPEYRGASPIQRAILDGKNESGYTIFLITDRLDQGDILIQEKVKIEERDDFDSYRTKLTEEALKKLPSLIKDFAIGRLQPKKMPERKTKYAIKIKKEDGLIGRADNTESAMRKIRAFSRWPKTYLLLGGKRILIHSAHLDFGKLILDKVQPEGKKIMSSSDFKRGYPDLLTKLPEFVSLL